MITDPSTSIMMVSISLLARKVTLVWMLHVLRGRIGDEMNLS